MIDREHREAALTYLQEYGPEGRQQIENRLRDLQRSGDPEMINYWKLVLAAYREIASRR